jgi:hypothetical protein
VARWFLAAAAVAWGVPGLVGLAVAIGGADAVVPRLPDLAIGDAALGRTVITLAVACLLVAAAHAAVALALVRRAGWAASAGVLLAALQCIGWIGGAAAALTSGAAGTIETGLAVGGAVLFAALAIGYGATAVALTNRLRRPEGAS